MIAVSAMPSIPPVVDLSDFQHRRAEITEELMKAAEDKGLLHTVELRCLNAPPLFGLNLSGPSHGQCR